MKRITPIFIKNLKRNEVLVFGSNEEGRHGKGLALYAIQFGAAYGQPEGHYGQTYAIPTRTFVDNKIETLGLDKISEYVDNFIKYAETRPDRIFLVTKIGMGLAGLNIKQIAPMFKEAIGVVNIHLPIEFWDELEQFIKKAEKYGSR